jgi:hypothetical protein
MAVPHGRVVGDAIASLGAIGPAAGDAIPELERLRDRLMGGRRKRVEAAIQKINGR